MMSNELKHQIQPTENTCTSTCLAMILGIPVWDIIEDFHDLYFSQKMNPMEYIHRFHPDWRCNSLQSVHDTWVSGRYYILTVPSLNSRTDNHSIIQYFPGQLAILDPNRGRKDSDYYVLPRDIHNIDDSKAVPLKSWTPGFEIYKIGDE